MTEDDERSNKFDDLFEDLDRFFAPNEPLAPPSGQAMGSPAVPSGTARGHGDGEDTLPAGWSSEVEGLGASGAPSASSAQPPPEPPDRPEAPVPPPITRRSEEPTAEMSPEDWTKLRGALGDED